MAVVTIVLLLMALLLCIGYLFLVAISHNDHPSEMDDAEQEEYLRQWRLSHPEKKSKKLRK